MFSLIITIISIALVAALALATIYYGGSAFNKGSAEARASQLINEGQQLNGAVALAKADFASGENDTQVATVGDLDPEYLAQIPTGWATTVDVTADSGVLTHTSADVTAEVCAAVNRKSGLDATVVLTEASANVYSCFTTGTGPAATRTVAYRF